LQEKLRGFGLSLLSIALMAGYGCGGSTSSSSPQGNFIQSSDKDITAFTFQGATNTAFSADVNGIISGTSIASTVPSGTVVTSLTPTVTITGASVSPPSGVAQDFTGPVTYTVTAEDGSTRAYTVTVTVTPASSAKDITQFTLSGVDGVIGGTHIAVPLASGAVNGIAPTTIAVSPGASVSPPSGVAQDFSNPVSYTVTAADGSEKQYTVLPVTPSATQKDITLFSVLGVDACDLAGCAGTLQTGGETGTAVLRLPAGTPLAALTPIIAVTSGAGLTPASGVAQDFTGPVTYTTNNPAATGGTSKTWNVTVTAGP
jgi:hypothetical protein